MKHTCKCANGHKFKSETENPACPQCGEPGTRIRWKTVEPEAPVKPGKKGDRKIIGKALDIAAAGLTMGLTAPSSSPGNAPDDEFSGEGGKFGGGGANGSF